MFVSNCTFGMTVSFHYQYLSVAINTEIFVLLGSDAPKTGSKLTKLRVNLSVTSSRSFLGLLNTT